MGIVLTQETVFPRGHGRGYQWRASLGEICVVRPTQKEARDALIETVQEIISGSYEPAVLTFGGYVSIVYRETVGWHYRVNRIAELADGSVSTVGLGRSTRTEAIRSARRHLVQIAYPFDHLHSLEYLEAAGDLAGVIDHAHWLGFQRAFSKAKWGAEAAGTEISNDELHRIAGAHGDDPDLLERSERIVIERVRARISNGG